MAAGLASSSRAPTPSMCKHIAAVLYEVAGKHTRVRETRKHVGVQQRGETQLIEEEGARIGRWGEIKIEAGRRPIERAAVRSTDDFLEHGGWPRAVWA